MAKGKIIYNKKEKVWHISGWGYNFKTLPKARKFKKLKLLQNKLEIQINNIKNKTKGLTI